MIMTCSNTYIQSIISFTLKKPQYFLFIGDDTTTRRKIGKGKTIE